MSGLDAGTLRHVVRLLPPPAAGQDAVGQPLDDDPAGETVLADVRYPSGTETIRAGAETAAVRASVRIRWRPGVTTAHRLVIDDRRFDIAAVLPDPSGRLWLDLVARSTS